MPSLQQCRLLTTKAAATCTRQLLSRQATTDMVVRRRITIINPEVVSSFPAESINTQKHQCSLTRSKG